jgi:hypothetical protein
MPDQNQPYDPQKDAESHLRRRNYHRAEEQKYSRWHVAAETARSQEPNLELTCDLTALSDHCDAMRNYHATQAEQANADLRRAQDRANDRTQMQTAALRAAADAADMAGAPTLATELNRRAAEAEGYNPDTEDGDEPWYNPQPDERAAN